MTDCLRCLRESTRDGLAWCNGCTRRLAADIRHLPDDLAELEVTKARSRASTSGGPASRETPMPYDLRASELMSAIRVTLVSWTKMIAEERGEGVPADTIEEITAYVVSRLGWLAKHPAAREFTDEMVSLIASVERVIDLPAVSRMYACRCPIEYDGEKCTGDVWALIRRDWGQSVCRCSVCGYEWKPDAWVTLGVMVGKEPAWLTAENVVEISGRSLKTVYNAASRLGWERRVIGATMYRRADVDAWLASGTPPDTLSA